MDPSPKKLTKGSRASTASDVEYRGSNASESESGSIDAVPDSPLFPGFLLPSASMTVFRPAPASLQPPPPLYNSQQFSASAVPALPTGPSQADILEAQRKELEKLRRRNEKARAKRLREQQEKVAQERAAAEHAAQARVEVLQQPVPQTAFAATAHPNSQAFPLANVPVQHSTPASSNPRTRHAPGLSSSQRSRANPQERAVQYPPCPLCSHPHEPGECPALNDLQSLYFLREQIRNEPGIETSEERVSAFILAMALS